jgi:CubicO group peptidase (beta-lactamase class C family)
MSTGGFSSARLRRMHDVLAGHVDRGGVPGAVALVCRRGEVHVDALGKLADGSGHPMQRDSLFRISSMTKPITAAAAMILIEECRLRLDDPIDDLLPELANRRVLARLDGALDDTVPARRSITVRDLLTFRLGFGVVMAMPDAMPILRAADKLAIGLGPPNPAAMPAPDEWLRRFGTLPLMHQPGEQWMYNTGSDVLGVLIARAANQALGTFLRERIFEPLGMKDTGFSVPTADLDRLATAYRGDPGTGALVVYDRAAGGAWAQPPAFPSGGGGLVSTVDDMLAFARMMMGGGKLAGARVLSRPSIETMTRDHLTPAQKEVSGLVPGYFDAHGWGFGLAVTTRRDDVGGSVGSYGWDGGLGTSWYSDPEEELIGVLMTQRMWTSPSPPPVCRDFWTAVYAAIDD